MANEIIVLSNWFPDYKASLTDASAMKLHTLTHHESRMTPIEF